MNSHNNITQHGSVVRNDVTVSVSDHKAKLQKQLLMYGVTRQISPITGPRCPEGSRKLRFPDNVTMAQDSGKVVSLTHRPLLPPGNNPGTHFC